MKILNLSQSQRATFKQRPQITHKQASYETQDNMQLSTGNALESIGRAKVMFQGNTQIANQENPNDLGDGITIKLTPNPNQPNLCTCEILGIPEFIEKYKQGKIPNALYDVIHTDEELTVELIRTSTGKEVWIYNGTPSLQAYDKFYD